MLETFRDRISKKNIDRCLSRNCQMNLFGEIFNSELKECNKVVVLVFVVVVVAVVAVLAVEAEVGADAAVVAGEAVVSVDEDFAIAVVVFAANVVVDVVAFQMPAMLDIFLKKI